MLKKTLALVLLSAILLASLYLGRCHYLDCEINSNPINQADTTQANKNIDASRKVVQKKIEAASQEKTELLSKNQQLEQALTSYQSATLERESAEAQLETIEQQVEAFELELDAIEEAGGDPATDEQVQSLEKFQTLFNDYQDTMRRLELAEAAEQKALSDLESAQ